MIMNCRVEKKTTFDFATEKLPGFVQVHGPLLKLWILDLRNERRIFLPIARAPVIEFQPFAIEITLDEIDQLAFRRLTFGRVHQVREIGQHVLGVEAEFPIDKRLGIVKQARHLNRVQQRAVTIYFTERTTVVNWQRNYCTRQH